MKINKEILNRIITGLSDKNIRFSALIKLISGLGFDERIKGDHHIFTRNNVVEIINIQPLKNGKAKAYQVKQIRSIILKYKLHHEVSDV